MVKNIMNEGWKSFLDRKAKTVAQKIGKKYQYKLWILKNEPRRAELKAMQNKSQYWSYMPKVSIITPVHNPRKYDLIQCIKSVLNQVYDNWEFCLVDGGSDKAYVREILKKYAEKDHRIKYVILLKNMGIAGNSNEALKLATGEYVGFLDHDDMLAPFALFEVVKLLNQDPSIDFIYSDEDKITQNGRKRYDPYFKPEWSPDTFLSYNYFCHFTVVRRKIVEEMGGFREGYDGAQDYDLFLRIIQKTPRIKRIPKILYHWRATQGYAALNLSTKPNACASAKKAIMEYLKNKGLDAEVLDGLFLTSYRVKYRIRPYHKVCIIIPTNDKVHLLKQCVMSLLSKTDYENFEILIVNNQSIEKETYDYFKTLEDDKRIKILQYDNPFNYSAINNFAVNFTDAGYLLFLNNDIEVISNEWLTAMLEFAQRENVGVVGAKLYYPDSTIQHAGVVIGLNHEADHVHKHISGLSNGYMGRINIVQNLSAVTGACMMIRKKVFEEVRGFDERLSHAYNDIDLCLKIREKGYLIVYTPYAVLYHHEAASRGYEDTPGKKARLYKEKAIIKDRWKHIIEAGDPYYNPNLTIKNKDISLKL